jgi:hypothetical protein
VIGSSSAVTATHFKQQLESQMTTRVVIHNHLTSDGDVSEQEFAKTLRKEINTPWLHVKRDIWDKMVVGRSYTVNGKVGVVIEKSAESPRSAYGQIRVQF